MNNKAFDLDAYLARLNHSGPLRPTQDCLEALHRAQLYTIPFENFDIQLGRGIALEPEALCDKLVHRARGGYCFELNGLFLMALHAIGFEARPLLGRVHLVDPPSGREHLFILVTMQGRPWIADVGFGGPGFRAPIPFALDRPTSHDGLTFRLVEAGPFGIMLQALKQGQWLDLYSFDLGHVFPADIALGNHFTSTHPASLFTFARVVALPTPSGRVSLLNRTLRIVTDGAEQVRELAEGQAYLDALKIHFGIELDASYAALRPLPGAGQGKGPELEW
ncbi:arylamine N-acetyltransferase family protein [Azotobacter beijerinckii]|uniref:N-hydroxyarylamine O-acetyltransferase n=1 Tax=Azotobacter beijerinckii TaxID=170623 RepID=A0A1I4E8H8_9GAMM|nr:arylamine N-acetyltransferase [Azotobacter beijerinckii]SFB46822.1 N-hydroxyarylamine O-acetyltransferase [Azotobacter beijerinckii]SFL01583.1 N-hydroxyarylamine O-acetyltransferase [Azotobacter beijerinckii]